jgi:2-keto-4-pentenoate hydratase/2-oxohepta-3-ene-1,7-dioic acid hydratase in catechol pathway
MKPGDMCEVEIEGVGLLTNPIIGELDLDEQGGSR